MAASQLVDLVQIYATSAGTGALTLGQAVPGYRGTEALLNGGTYSYSIQQGANYELGTGTYLSTGHEFIRTPEASSNGNAAVDLAANARVSFVALSRDILARDVLQPLYGYGAPLPGAGLEGQVYYDLNPPVTLYGPKMATGWGAGVELQGPAGSSNNSVATLAELKASLVSNLTALYDNAVFTFTLGDYSAQIDDLNFVESDDVPATTGAWVRQDATSLPTPSAFPSVPATIAQNVDHIVPFSQFASAGSDVQCFNAAIDAMNTRGTDDVPGGISQGTRIELPQGRMTLNGPLNKVYKNGGITFNGQGDATELVCSYNGVIFDFNPNSVDPPYDVSGGIQNCKVTYPSQPGANAVFMRCMTSTNTFLRNIVYRNVGTLCQLGQATGRGGRGYPSAGHVLQGVNGRAANIARPLFDCQRGTGLVVMQDCGGFVEAPGISVGDLEGYQADVTQVSPNSPLIGNGSQTVFTFTYPSASATFFWIYVNGVKKTAGTDYSLTNVGNVWTLTFAVAPVNTGHIVPAFIKNRVSVLQTLPGRSAFKFGENHWDSAEGGGKWLLFDRGLDINAGLIVVDGDVVGVNVKNMRWRGTEFDYCGTGIFARSELGAIVGNIEFVDGYLVGWNEQCVQLQGVGDLFNIGIRGTKFGASRTHGIEGSGVGLRDYTFKDLQFFGPGRDDAATSATIFLYGGTSDFTISNCGNKQDSYTYQYEPDYGLYLGPEIDGYVAEGNAFNGSVSDNNYDPNTTGSQNRIAHHNRNAGYVGPISGGVFVAPASGTPWVNKTPWTILVPITATAAAAVSIEKNSVPILTGTATTLHAIVQVGPGQSFTWNGDSVVVKFDITNS